MNSEKEIIKSELDKLIETRSNFYDYLDKNIPKKGEQFDFSSNPKLDAKEIYDLFYRLDYQARKLRGFLVKAYDLKAE